MQCMIFVQKFSEFPAILWKFTIVLGCSGVRTYIEGRGSYQQVNNELIR